jgi:thiamine-phosphate pyrophosphorylase
MMMRCAITSGEGWEAAIERARGWAELGVEFVQLREKQLAAGELVRLAAAVREALGERGGRTKLLVNGRADVAVAAGADGVHLTARVGELTVEQVRQVFRTARAGEPVVSVSCHSLDEVRRAVADGVDLILFGPVFEKRVFHLNGQRTPAGDPGASELVIAGVGLEALREVCAVAGETPVLALGGVTWESAQRCVEAGAAGVAGMRLFGGVRTTAQE